MKVTVLSGGVGGGRFLRGLVDVVDPAQLRLVTSRSHRSPATDAIVQRLGITQETVSGSVGIKVGMIADRRADLYVHLSDRSSAWDACAPDAILRAAGGVFVDLGGRSLQYGGTELKNQHGILACNRKAYERVQPIITEIARSTGLV